MDFSPVGSTVIPRNSQSPLCVAVHRSKNKTRNGFSGSTQKPKGSRFQIWKALLKIESRIRLDKVFAINGTDNRASEYITVIVVVGGDVFQTKLLVSELSSVLLCLLNYVETRLLTFKLEKVHPIVGSRLQFGTKVALGVWCKGRRKSRSTLAQGHETHNGHCILLRHGCHGFNFRGCTWMISTREFVAISFRYRRFHSLLLVWSRPFECDSFALNCCIASHSLLNYQQSHYLS